MDVVSSTYHHIFLYLACLVRPPETIIVHGQFSDVKIRLSLRPEHLTRNLKISLETSTLFNMNFHPGNINLKKISFFLSDEGLAIETSASCYFYGDNGPFAAERSRGIRPPNWKANDALGHVTQSLQI